MKTIEEMRVKEDKVNAELNILRAHLWNLRIIRDEIKSMPEQEFYKHTRVNKYIYNEVCKAIDNVEMQCQEMWKEQKYIKKWKELYISMSNLEMERGW